MSKESVKRVEEYIARRKKSRGIDIEHVHGFDVGPDCGVELLLSDIEAIISAAAPQVVADERKGSPYPDYDRGFSNGWDACAKRAAAPVQAQEQWIDKLTYDAQVDEWAIEKGNLELEIEALKSRTPVQAQEPIGYAPTYLTERMAAGDSAVMLTVTRKPLPGHGVTVALYTAPVQPADVPDGKYGRLTGDNIAQPVQMKVETK